MITATDFLVSRDNLRDTRFAERGIEPGDGQLLLRVDGYALTANNITYAAFGVEMRYWDFFPAPDGWGMIPVWGFAEVIESRCEGIAAGERVYGYLPMSTHLVVTPERVSERGFADASPHRAGLSPVYNNYIRWSRVGRSDDERAYMLFRPLYTTSFLLDDFLADSDVFGADAVILSSASSKTALGLAQALGAREGIERVGLTSAGNAAFVADTGFYDRVISYDEIEEIDLLPSAVYVDFSGDGGVRESIHRTLGDRLRHDCVVGGTHWEERGGGADLPGPRPLFFFAPTQLQKRIGEWGAAEFDRRLEASWDGFIAATHGWLEFVEARGTEAIAATYQQMLEGRVSPSEGHILHPV